MDKKNIALGILGVVLLATGTLYYLLVGRSGKNPPKVIFEKIYPEKKVNNEKFTLYLPDDNLEKLVRKEIEIASETNNNKTNINRVFDIIKSEMNYRFSYKNESGATEEAYFLDEGVKLLNIYEDGSDLYLNFNYKFKDSMKTSEQELLVIYSIVNTIIESSKYKRVKILVNNKEIEKLNFYRLSKFYEKNLEI